MKPVTAYCSSSRTIIRHVSDICFGIEFFYDRYPMIADNSYATFFWRGKINRLLILTAIKANIGSMPRLSVYFSVAFVWINVIPHRLHQCEWLKDRNIPSKESFDHIHCTLERRTKTVTIFIFWIFKLPFSTNIIRKKNTKGELLKEYLNSSDPDLHQSKRYDNQTFSLMEVYRTEHMSLN